MTIRVGIGGLTFEPWRGVFYPKGLLQKRELECAVDAIWSGLKLMIRKELR